MSEGEAKVIHTKEVTLAEYEEMVQKQAPRTVPILKARAIVDVIDKEGNLKASLEFSTDALEDADNANS